MFAGGGILYRILSIPLILIVTIFIASFLSIFSFPFISHAEDTFPDAVSNNINPSDISSTIKDGTYRIVPSIDSSLSLSIGETIHTIDPDNPATYNVPNVCIKTTNETDDGQLWNIKRNDDDTYTIENKAKTGYVINYDIYNACIKDTDFAQSTSLGTENEQNVMCWGTNNTKAQKWSFHQYGNTNWFSIQNPHGIVLDVKKGNKKSGTNVDGYKLNNSAAQKWHLVPVNTANDATDTEDNITFSIPTEVPCYEKADGTVISPDKTSWQICNLGTKPITLTGVSITDTNNEAIKSIDATAAGLKLETNTTDETKDIQDGIGIWTIHATPTSNASLTKSPDKGRLAVIRKGEQAGFDWTIKLTDNGKHNISNTKSTLGNISFNFGQVFESNTDETNGKAFAIYSNTDKSLNYYKRKEIPVAGEWFCGKEITHVYTDFDTNEYTISDPENWEQSWQYQTTNVPWFDIHDIVDSVDIIDYGIKPTSLKLWFYQFYNAKTINLTKLNLSSCKSLGQSFLLCQSATAINIPSITSTCKEMTDTFSMCQKLLSLNIADSDFSGITAVTHKNSFWHCFYKCPVTYNASNWNVTVNVCHAEFNQITGDINGNVTLPKPWQLTAFAIYSPDDNSLDFYKRAYGYMPAVGDTFNGKSVGEIYTGFETDVYVKTSGTNASLRDAECNTPWFSHRLDIVTASIIDTGITPTNLSWWFCRFENLTQIDLSLLDCSKLTIMDYAITGCLKLMNINMPQTMPLCTKLTDAFYYNPNLESLDLSCLNAKPKVFWGTFALCSKLKNLKLANQIVKGDMSWCFQGDYELNYDCTDWDVSNASHSIATIEQTFPSNVMRPKAWQTS